MVIVHTQLDDGAAEYGYDGISIFQSSSADGY
jgi:hypothetical protein